MPVCLPYSMHVRWTEWCEGSFDSCSVLYYCSLWPDVYSMGKMSGCCFDPHYWEEGEPFNSITCRHTFPLRSTSSVYMHPWLVCWNLKHGEPTWGQLVAVNIYTILLVNYVPIAEQSLHHYVYSAPSNICKHGSVFSSTLLHTEFLSEVRLRPCAHRVTAEATTMTRQHNLPISVFCFGCCYCFFCC